MWAGDCRSLRACWHPVIQVAFRNIDDDSDVRHPNIMLLNPDSVDHLSRTSFRLKVPSSLEQEGKVRLIMSEESGPGFEVMLQTLNIHATAHPPNESH